MFAFKAFNECTVCARACAACARVACPGSAIPFASVSFTHSVSLSLSLSLLLSHMHLILLPPMFVRSFVLSLLFLLRLSLPIPPSLPAAASPLGPSSSFLCHLQGESAPLRRPNGMSEPAIDLLGQGFQTRQASLSLSPHPKGGHRYLNHKIIGEGESQRERERERGRIG